VQDEFGLHPCDWTDRVRSLWQVEHAFRELKSGLEIGPVYVRTENHVRGHIVVCFLALVLEAALQRLLNKQGTTDSYREVLCDIEQFKALCFEARGKKWLWRNELPGKACDAFHAIGMRPPPRVQPLAWSSSTPLAVVIRHFL
jgi:hypothetical protein